MFIGIELKPYYRRTDNDGHTYYVPCEEIEEFDWWNNMDTESDEFYAHPGFNHYSLGRCDGDIKMYIDPKDL